MRLSQVLIHLGTTLGQEVVGTGVEEVSVSEGVDEVSSGETDVGTAMVEVEVRVCVEIVV
jgi:hypothetical protein